MKTFKFLALATVLLLGLQSCVKDQCKREVTYIKATPIYKSLDEIRAEITAEEARDLVNPGKIYFYNNYIFINESREGVHIIDNSNPATPNNIGFLTIPGNVDISIKNNILYADNYTDLLTIDITDVRNATLLKRTENAFPNFGTDTEGRLLVYYEHEEVTELLDCDTDNGGWGWQEDIAFAVNESSGGFGDSPGGAGVGGSLARFTITDGHLYTVDQWDLDVYDLSQANCPSLVNTINIGWDIETIYASEQKLFFGSNSGMTIYDISNPATPVYLSGYSHWTACDPVYVKDNYAYVTLRSGTLCNGSTLNQLDLVDISDITNPILVNSFPMDNPHGLSGKEENLFLCEGTFGLKTFDISDPLTLDKNLLDHKTDRAATDVIVVPGDQNVLLVIGEDGFYQYNFDDPLNMRELSFIPVIGKP